MTAFYGSKAEPKKEFGDGTPELNAFYKAMYQLAPGPTQLLEVLLDSWQPYALSHNWQLPDGFEARVRVMQRVEKDIEVDELNHSTFTYVYYENEGEEKGVKNAANIIHSIDGYVLRSLVRRCSFDPDLVRMAIDEIQTELVRRACGEYLLDAQCTKPVQKYFDLYQRTGMADIVVIEHLTTHDLQILPYEYIRRLLDILNTLDHNPFPIVTVHDDFTCHPNNMNHLRKHYRNILAELADSELISDILSQLHGYRGRFEKLSNNLSEKIRQSNYSLC